jgi:hypothetical protein
MTSKPNTLAARGLEERHVRNIITYFCENNHKFFFFVKVEGKCDFSLYFSVSNQFMSWVDDRM